MYFDCFLYAAIRSVAHAYQAFKTFIVADLPPLAHGVGTISQRSERTTSMEDPGEWRDGPGFSPSLSSSVGALSGYGCRLGSGRFFKICRRDAAVPASVAHITQAATLRGVLSKSGKAQTVN